MLRDGDEWREAAWEDALIAACDGLRETVDSHGADEVGRKRAAWFTLR